MPACFITYCEQEHKRPLPEFGGENLKGDDETAVSGGRVRPLKTESEERNNGQSASQDLNPSSDNELKLIVNEVVDKLGTLSDEEIKKIREWLELGS